MLDRPLADDEGNEIPAPPPDSPVAQIIYLLEYGRKRGFRIGPTVQVGDTIVQVNDIWQRKRELDSAPGETEPDIWKQHGYTE